MDTIRRSARRICNPGFTVAARLHVTRRRMHHGAPPARRPGCIRPVVETRSGDDGPRDDR